MADLEHRGTLRYTVDDVADVARALLSSIDANRERGTISPEESIGGRATVIGFLLMLGITVGLGGDVYVSPEDYQKSRGRTLGDERMN